MTLSLAGERPTLWPGFDQWLEAFWCLSTERHAEMGASPIPESSILWWADRFVAGDEIDGFRQCIREMDAAFLDYMNTPEDKRRVVLDTPLSPGLLRSKLA